MTEMTPEKESKSNTPPKALVSSPSLSSPPHCCLLDVDVDVLIVSTHSTSTSTSTSTDTDVDVLAIKDALPVTSKERAVLMENEPAPPARARQRKTSKVLLDIIYPHCPVAPEEKGLLGAAEDPEAAKDWAVLDNSTLAHSAGAGAVVALSGARGWSWLRRVLPLLLLLRPPPPPPPATEEEEEVTSFTKRQRLQVAVAQVRTRMHAVAEQPRAVP